MSQFARVTSLHRGIKDIIGICHNATVLSTEGDVTMSNFTQELTDKTERKKERKKERKNERMKNIWLNNARSRGKQG